jgi:hypothetical protein
MHKLWSTGKWVTAACPRSPAPRWGDSTCFTSGFIGGAAHFKCSLILVFQVLAYFMEGCQLPPAGPHCAGARHAMALAGGLHSSLDHLQDGVGSMRNSLGRPRDQLCR